MIQFDSFNTVVNYILVFIAIIFCICLQLAILFLFFQQKQKQQKLKATILLVLNINLLMQMTIPLILGVIFSFSIENEFKISLFRLCEVVFLQFMYIVIFLITFLYKNNRQEYVIDLLKKPYFKAGKRFDVKFNFDNKVFIFIVIGIYLLSTSFSVSGIVQTTAEIAGEVQKDNTFIDVINIYLRTMFEWAAIVTAILYIFTGSGPKLIKVIVILFCIAVVIKQLAMGLRGSIFIFLILVLFVSFLINNKINYLKLLPSLILLIPVFSFLGGSFREDITSGFLVEADTFERIEIIGKKILFPEKKSGADDKTFFESVYNRLEAPRNSVSLIKMFDEGNSVKFRPLISSLIALIPQQITGIKNYATSSTDNAFGAAMYVVKEKTYGYKDMGPFLTASHEYWEGGPLYVFISAFLIGLIWRKLVIWCSNRRYDTFSLIILLSILDAHHGEMSVLPPFALVVRVFYFQIIPIILFYYFICKSKIIFQYKFYCSK